MFNIGTDAWKIILPSVGALIGAMIGKPAFEFFKDWMSANREWKNKREEIIERLRFVYGNLNAFQEINERAVAQMHIKPERSLCYRKVLLTFDTKPLIEAIQQLATLSPRASDKSGSAQFLVSQLLLIVLLIKSAQKDKDEHSRNFTLENVNSRMKILDRFIEVDFARELEFEGFSFTWNAQRRNFMKEIQYSEIRTSIRLTEKIRSELNPTEPSER